MRKRTEYSNFEVRDFQDYTIFMKLLDPWEIG